MTHEEERIFKLDRLKEQFERCDKEIVCDNINVEELMLPTDDGLSLRTIIYRPDIDKPLPVVTFRTCYYNSDDVYRATAIEFAKRGFAYVYQYCRGIGGSEGIWEPNKNERTDGKCFIDWLDSQEWVKSIGYAGCSYLASTGWIIADIVPPKVKTMHLTHYGCLRHTSAYSDGLFRHDVLTSWAMDNAGFPINADYIKSCEFMPHIEVDEKLWGKRLDWYRKLITTEDGSDKYWHEGYWGIMREIPKRVNIPLYIGEGWYDHHLGSAIETYKLLPEETKKKSVFAIGPWDHNFNVVTNSCIETGKNFNNDDVLSVFNWMYDLLIKEEEKQGSVDCYVIGDDTWNRDIAPEAEKKVEKRLYLSVADEKKILDDADNTKAGEIEFVYDPGNPLPTYGAESCLHSCELQGSLEQPQADYRSDVVSFVSQPLQDEITVLGNVRVKLTVASDCEDTAFSAKIIEVMESGKAYNVRTGITTLNYGAQKKDEKNASDEGIEIAVKMWNIAWKFQKGSRIRIDISSSDFPQYSIHRNQKGHWAEMRENKIAHQKILVGKNKSYIAFSCKT